MYEMDIISVWEREREACRVNDNWNTNIGGNP